MSLGEVSVVDFFAGRPSRGLCRFLRAPAQGYNATGNLAGAGNGALQGGVTGMLSAGATAGAGMMGNAPGRVLANATAGGVQSEMQGGNFADGFRKAGLVSGLSESALAMRQAMIEDSQKNPFNAQGKSVGFQGDGVKIGGGRCI